MIQVNQQYKLRESKLKSKLRKKKLIEILPINRISKLLSLSLILRPLLHIWVPQYKTLYKVTYALIISLQKYPYLIYNWEKYIYFLSLMMSLNIGILM